MATANFDEGFINNCFLWTPSSPGTGSLLGSCAPVQAPGPDCAAVYGTPEKNFFFRGDIHLWEYRTLNLKPEEPGYWRCTLWNLRPEWLGKVYFCPAEVLDEVDEFKHIDFAEMRERILKAHPDISKLRELRMQYPRFPFYAPRHLKFTCWNDVAAYIKDGGNMYPDDEVERPAWKPPALGSMEHICLYQARALILDILKTDEELAEAREQVPWFVAHMYAPLDVELVPPPLCMIPSLDEGVAIASKEQSDLPLESAATCAVLEVAQVAQEQVAAVVLEQEVIMAAEVVAATEVAAATIMEAAATPEVVSVTVVAAAAAEQVTEVAVSAVALVVTPMLDLAPAQLPTAMVGAKLSSRQRKQQQQQQLQSTRSTAAASSVPGYLQPTKASSLKVRCKAGRR
ncbi:hypothetical protein PLESTB_001220200 [Pleodorina starrii]|uniref:Uncharacterized protein n=1 Tax=Pleodorina starrii TaxID=330485 RepID=A0A9W6BTC1_9CHLO|nr:hypothetical protein PLESTB_001220200 [Pleodorina starrii]